MSDILNDSAKEKVTRIILAVFRNLIEKPEDSQVAKEHCIAMVQCKVLKQLSILEQRRYDDEDISGDVEFLIEKLQNSVQDLSSFDEYATEIKSGRYAQSWNLRLCCRRCESKIHFSVCLQFGMVTSSQVSQILA